MYKTENLKAAITGHVCIHRDIQYDLSLLSMNLTLAAFKGKVKKSVRMFIPYRPSASHPNTQ
jgi:hypothetical protein